MNVPAISMAQSPQEPINVVPKGDRLYELYSSMSDGSTTLYKHRDNKRVINVYKAPKGSFMTKETKTLNEPLLNFTQYVRNIGTKENPILATYGLALDAPHGSFEIRFKQIGDSMQGIMLTLLRRVGFDTSHHAYRNLMELRNDKKYFLPVLQSMIGKGKHIL
ncbi:hypothetical protein IJ541_05745 [bacterium]|nr:hypothetical protein [bacterium]